MFQYLGWASSGFLGSRACPHYILEAGQCKHRRGETLHLPICLARKSLRSRLKHVLITRPEPDASETAARIQALGLGAIVAPIFALRFLPNMLPVTGRIAATVLTSRNAIGACPLFLYDLPAFAVGPATTKRAMQAGFRHVINGDGNADALAERIRQDLSPQAGTVLLPTTTGQGTQLAAVLRQRGFRVLRRVAYKISRLPVLPERGVTALRAGEVGAALFFSTESASHFVHLVISAGLEEMTRDIEAVSISERPIMALRRLPWRRISVAARPNQDAMLALLS
ncbi:MAG TPA: uroporphyrinogen-III synthase [Rhodopila sp.]|nr:uroporphyrinogen-III synthase [Rhodopila sp.]